MHETKKNLRRELQKKITSLSPAFIRKASKTVRKNLTSLKIWKEARTVLLYLPAKICERSSKRVGSYGEVDTWELLEELWSENKITLLPKIINKNGDMDVAEVSSGKEIETGFFGLPAPAAAACWNGPPPDLALIPGLAFDHSGFRLGRGGGYYDRFLGKFANAPSVLVGLAFDFQILPTLPVEPFDLPVNIICTEKETIWTTSALISPVFPE